jgi:hypothetical protein
MTMSRTLRCPLRGTFAAALLLASVACERTDTPAALPEARFATDQLDAQLALLRRETAPFHNLANAKAAGYSEQITPCWAHRAHGAMGYHYGNSNLFDATVELLEPELLMYEPQPGGHLRLVGMEYLVPVAAWTAQDPPQLLGQQFQRHATLPIYKLHIWLWRNNPEGTFADWNPQVSCRSADATEIFE